MVQLIIMGRCKVIEYDKVEATYDFSMSFRTPSDTGMYPYSQKLKFFFLYVFTDAFPKLTPN